MTKKPRKRKPRRSPPPTHLGVNLRRLREARGLSAQGLADIAGMNRVTVSNIELGKADTSLTALLQLAAALGVRPEEIIEAPQTAAPIEPQIKAFLESPYAAVTRPTKDELEWLRSRCVGCVAHELQTNVAHDLQFSSACATVHLASRHGRRRVGGSACRRAHGRTGVPKPEREGTTMDACDTCGATRDQECTCPVDERAYRPPLARGSAEWKRIYRQVRDEERAKKGGGK